MPPQHNQDKMGSADNGRGDGGDVEMTLSSPHKNELPISSNKNRERREQDDKEDNNNNTNKVETSNDISFRQILTPSTITLCLCMLTHSYLLISVFPYSAYLAMHLKHVDQEQAGRYAGWLASAFMLGRATTSILWGVLADKYGRKLVLSWSLILSCIASLCFGVAPTFYTAVFARFMLGLVNGIMGTIKTLISEVSQSGGEAMETKTMSLVIGMWGWGFLICPAISGALAEPQTQYTQQEWLRQGILGVVLEKFPFILPNILGAMMCLVGSIGVHYLVEETLPNPESPITTIKQWYYKIASFTSSRQSKGPRYQRVYEKEHQSNVFNTDSDDSDTEIKVINDETGITTKNSTNDTEVRQSADVSMMTLFSRRSTRTCLLIYWLYSFVNLCVDEVFPLFCVSHQAGLGLAENQIGKILSVCGLLFVLGQYFVYDAIYNRYGLYGSIRIGSSLGPIILLVTPFSLWFNKGEEAGVLRTSTFIYLAILMAMYRILALVFFSNISVAVNRTVPNHERAAMNGVSVLGGSLSKGLGPTFAGYLTYYSVSWLGPYGSWLIFSTVALFGAAVFASTMLYLDENDETNHSNSPKSTKSTTIELSTSIADNRIKR